MASVLPEILRLRQTISVQRFESRVCIFQKPVLCFLIPRKLFGCNQEDKDENRMD